MELILIILSIVLLVGSILFLFRFLNIRKSYLSLQDRYKGITDRDLEIQKRKDLIVDLTHKQVALENDRKKRLQELSDEYSKYKTTYDDLRKELTLLEENLDIQSYGVYKPHYDYTNSEEYKIKIEQNYDKQKALIKAEGAALCSAQWTVGGSRREGERMTKQYAKLMLRAFNGESDASIMKVRWNNILIMEERIRKAYETINKTGTVHNINISQDYLDLIIDELRLNYEMQNKLYKEKEEQRRIQEQMREEEKDQREIEQAKIEAEDEERRYQNALEKARTELEKAKGAQLDELNKKIMELERELQAAHELKERAISRAQMTKSGYVYIISNIGSFGENIFKIGMTRRLEPMDRIRELGDASVPFNFDVHAMVYSDNAPELEYKLHMYFEKKQMNLVNERKEFFSVNIDEIEEFAKANNLPVTITKLAEAKEYRETLALRQQAEILIEPTPETNPFPDKLINAN